MIYELALKNLIQNIQTVSKNINNSIDRKKFFSILVQEMEEIYKKDQLKEA